MGEQTPSGWAESPDHLRADPAPKMCSYLIHELHPVWSDLFPALPAGRSGAEPKADGKARGEEQVSRVPNMAPPKPTSCSFPSPIAGSVLAGDITTASCTPLSGAGHHWHLAHSSALSGLLL